MLEHNKKLKAIMDKHGMDSPQAKKALLKEVKESFNEEEIDDMLKALKIII